MQSEPLASVATVTMGQSPKGDTCATTPNGSPLLNGPTEFGDRHPTPVQWTSAPARLAEPGDVLLCVRGSTTGRMNRADQPYAIGRGLAAVRGENPEDTAYLGFALRATLPALLRTTSGSVFPNLSSRDVRSHKIPWPGRAVRAAIVEVLGTLDDKMEGNTSLILAARNLARSVLHEASRAAHGDYVVRSVASVRRGLSYTGAGLAEVGSGMPMVNLANAASFGWLKREGFKYYTGPYKPRHVAAPGSLLVGGVDLTWKLEILGYPMLLPDDMDPALFSQDMYLVDFEPEHAWLRLPLWAHLYSSEARARIEGMAYGTTVARFPLEAVTGLSFPVPDPDSPVLRLAEDLLRRAWAAEMESQRLAELRDALLPGLMSGRIRVKDAETVVGEAV